jgi:hypothetical protein
MSPMVQIAQCHSAARYFRGQGVHCRVLIRRAPSGKIFHSVEKRNRSPDQHPRQIEPIILSTFASSRSMAGLVPSRDPFMGPLPAPDDESAVPNELVPGAAALVPKAPPVTDA